MIKVDVKLIGSEKQVAWAERIRNQWIESVNKLIVKAEAKGKPYNLEYVKNTENEISSKTEAKYWILKESDGSVPALDAINLLNGKQQHLK